MPKRTYGKRSHGLSAYTIKRASSERGIYYNNLITTKLHMSNSKLLNVEIIKIKKSLKIAHVHKLNK